MSLGIEVLTEDIVTINAEAASINRFSILFVAK